MVKVSWWEYTVNYIVLERDAQAIAQKIDYLLSHPHQRYEMGMAARKKMETEYRYEDRIEALEKHYDAVIQAFG